MEAHAPDLKAFVDYMFSDGNAALSELRRLALTCLEKSENPDELLKEMMQEITQPDIPPAINEIRIMSLNKSKGLNSPFVFVAGCVQGLLPMQPEASLSIDEKNAQQEEQRRLFFVAITRTKADIENGKKGSLYLTYSETMPNGLALQAGIVPASSRYGIANLQPSTFLPELGKAAPKPVKG